MTTANRWSLPSVLLHWLMFVLIAAMFVLASMMEDAPKGPEKWALYDLHKSIGVSIFLLVIVRFVWNLKAAKPQPIGNDMQRKLATAGHHSLYLLMVLVPVSGYFMSVAGGHNVPFFSFGDLPALIGKNESLGHFAHEAHEILATLMMLAVAGHAAMGIYHHAVLKDDTLKRMSPFGK